MMVGEKHAVVVGAGAGGLTMALLLARAGRRVTLLEAEPHLGGSLQRFSRKGAPFDTGFHFTGGFGGLLSQMLAVLGIDDLVREEAFGNRLFFAENGRMLHFPGEGSGAVAEYLAGEYPESAAAVRRYFACEKFVMEQTPLADLRDRELMDKLALNEYDFISLDQFLDRIGAAGEVRAVLAGAAMCHGTPPCESPVTHHCRVSYGLNEHIARAVRGGDGFLDGFRLEAGKLGITVRTGVSVAECLETRERRCTRVRLDDGSELPFDEMFLAIHPRSVLALLPPEVVGRGLRERVAGFEDSCGFFTIWGVLDGDGEETSELTSFLSSADLNRILLPGGGAHGTGIVRAHETDSHGAPVTTLTAFRTVFPGEALAWGGFAPGDRGAGYGEYKAAMTEAVAEEVFRVYPDYRRRLKILDSASMLSFRDYLPPSGCAYGVRRKLGETHLFGRLPVRNFYALGQSALVPGVLGSMMTSFLLFRQLVGDERYFEVIREIL